jgi:hypothetical protein
MGGKVSGRGSVSDFIFPLQQEQEQQQSAFFFLKERRYLPV